MQAAHCLDLSPIHHPNHYFLFPPSSFHDTLLITGGIGEVRLVRGQLSDLVEISQVRPDGVAQTFRSAFFDIFAVFEVTEVLHRLVVGPARSGDSIMETKAQSD